MTGATVLLSGGIDSACCVHFLKSRGFSVSGLYVDFNQASAAIEWQKVCEAGEFFRIEVAKISCKSESIFGAGELTGRNGFLVFAGMLLGKCDAGLIVLGLHSGTPYFDSSAKFVEMLEPLVRECSSGKLELHTPFISWSKADVYKYFNSTGIPKDMTYSCEAGSQIPCGSCQSCQDRRLL